MLDNLKNIKLNIDLVIYKKLVFITVISVTILLVVYLFIYRNRVEARHLCEEKQRNVEQKLKEAESKVAEMENLKSQSEVGGQDEFIKKIKTSKIEQIPTMLKSLTKDSIKLINFQPQEEKVLTFKGKNINSQKISIEMEMSFPTIIELLNKIRIIPVLNKVESLTITREESIAPFVKVNMNMILYSGDDLNI